MEMKELLQKIDFFEGLEEKILKKLADAVIAKQFGRDEVVIRQGETGLGLYIIVRGRVKVEKESDGTRFQVAELGSEEFFAEMSIVDNKPRSATVTTLEDTECLLLTRDSFVTLMKKYPEIPIRIARLLAERLRAADEKLASLAPAAAAASAASAAGPPAPPQTAHAGNGASGATSPASEGTKTKIQDALLGFFSDLYTMKAFTRFSVAVLGCPVEGKSPKVVDEIRAGDVKALILPAGERVDLDILARESGSFTLHVFAPDRDEPARFGPLPVTTRDQFRLSVDLPGLTLTNRGQPVKPIPAGGRQSLDGPLAGR